MTPPIDESKLNALMGRVVGDFGAAASAVLVVIGDKLGLYRALRDGPLTAVALAAKTQTTERYVREWANANAAGGYLGYEDATDRYTLSPEQALAFAEADSPAFVPGFFYVVEAMMKAEEVMTENFRTGAGMSWGEHAHCLFVGTERFFRPGYIANLTQSWIPALQGVEEKLRAGAKVADIGCGLGASTVLMAQAFPRSRFIGFDVHPKSVELARERAAAAGVEDRVSFEVARSTDYPGVGYDFVAHFDCLHDMGDPVAAARHVRRTLAPDGTWMIVEPFAGERIQDNLTPLGRIFYSASTMLCVPNALSDGGKMSLGAQAGEERLRRVAAEGGFSRLRRATETPFNLILEARP